MKILMTSIGSRGDIEPFLAIGRILAQRGHHITCLFPEQFRESTNQEGFDFESLGPEFLEILDSPIGQAALGGSAKGLSKVNSYIQLAGKFRNINQAMVIKQRQVIENLLPDVIVHNGKVIFPVIWNAMNKGKSILVSPVPYLHYVKGHAHLAFNSNFGSILNKFTFWIARFGLTQTIMSSLKSLDLKNLVRRKKVIEIQKRGHTLYTISPSLFPRSNDWHENIKVVGYHDRPSEKSFQPTEDLIQFLERHDKILFITFGSMTNPSPREKTQAFIDVLTQQKIPAIFNIASGGLQAPDRFNEKQFFFINGIPYDYIFSKVYAAIHHGGSGTTHMGLKYQLPTMIIPHIIDQFVWNKMIRDLGVGPLGCDISQVKVSKLAPRIHDLWTNTGYKSAAIKLGQKIQEEDLQAMLVTSIENV